MTADACRCLGLPYGGARGSTGQHLRRVGADEKRLITRNEGFEVTLFAGQRGGSLTLVSESGLYKLIMRSDKATARPFQDWVKGGRRRVDPPSSLTAHAVLVRFSDGAP